MAGFTTRQQDTFSDVSGAIGMRLAFLLCPVFSLFCLSFVQGQSPLVDSPMSRMRPIGTYAARTQRPTQVPQIAERQPNPPGIFVRETGYTASANRVQPLGRAADSGQRTVRLQQFESPLPGGALPMPPTVSPRGVTPNGVAQDPSLPPGPIDVGRGALGNPIVGSPAAVAPRGMIPHDQMPIPAPQLSSGFATIGNSSCVSGPSSYSAACGGCCSPVSYQAPVFSPTAIVPATIPGGFAGPTILPNGLSPQTPLGAGVPGALISFGQQANPVVVGQGLFGQPVAYVPGQTLRNWLRYVFP